MQDGIDFILYSDGGSSQEQSDAAAACIVEDAVTAERVQLLGYLGRGTNNEAEIFGGLLGLAFLAVLPDREHMESCSVRWVCDSEYVLKSATSYIRTWERNGWRTAAKAAVKNQGLWRTFLQLSAQVRIVPKHVRGHTGHVENEMCDEAIQWMKANARDVFSCGKTSAPVSWGPSGQWIAIDLRPIVASLRTENPDSADLIALTRLMREMELLGFSEAQSMPPAPPEDPFDPVLGRLQEASILAERLRGRIRGADNLADAILCVLKQFGTGAKKSASPRRG